MRVAIPFWMERVSPVFDVANRLLLVDVEKSVEVACSELRIAAFGLANRAERIAALGVEALICGSISEPLKLLLEGKGVEVIDQICGNIDEVLRAFLEGHLDDDVFLMPGCCRKQRRRFGPN